MPVRDLGIILCLAQAWKSNSRETSFTSHQDLQQLQLQYLFVWGILNIVSYLILLFWTETLSASISQRLNFPTFQCKEKACGWSLSVPFFNLEVPQLNLTIGQIVGSKSLQYSHGTGKNYCPFLRMPSQDLPKVARVGLWLSRLCVQAIGICQRSGSRLVVWSGDYLWSAWSHSSVLSEIISSLFQPWWLHKALAPLVQEMSGIFSGL